MASIILDSSKGEEKMRAYSLDLRKKVLAYLAKGHRVKDAINTFGVSRAVIHRWVRRAKAGNLEATPNTKRAPKKIDPLKLKEYVTRHPESTLKEIGSYFNASDVAALNRMREIGYSHKKKAFYTKNVKKKTGQNLKKSYRS